jgi:hypothetical protein
MTPNRLENSSLVTPDVIYSLSSPFLSDIVSRISKI